MDESPARGTQLAVACSTAFLPPCLAVYMRWSTFPTISSTDSGGTRYVATPMLAVTRQPCATTTSDNASRSFCTTMRAGAVAVSGSRTQNSSPPMRATRSFLRSTPVMARATERNTASRAGPAARVPGGQGDGREVDEWRQIGCDRSVRVPERCDQAESDGDDSRARPVTEPVVEARAEEGLDGTQR